MLPLQETVKSLVSKVDCKSTCLCHVEGKEVEIVPRGSRIDNIAAYPATGYLSVYQRFIDRVYRHKLNDLLLQYTSLTL